MASNIRRRSAAWTICRIGRIGQGEQCLYCGWDGHDLERSEGSKRTLAKAAMLEKCQEMGNRPAQLVDS
jgi:hypothetical protein